MLLAGESLRPIREGGSSRSAGRVDEFELTGGGAFDGPTAVVDQGVVSPAEKNEVVDVGLAEVRYPAIDVMNVTPLGRSTAAGEDAVPVADD
jgi:hypothetical protein